MPLERADHSVENSHERSPVGLGLVLVGNGLKLIDSEQVFDGANGLATWVLVVMKVEYVHKVGRDGFR